MNKTFRFIWEIVKVVVISSAIVIPIRYFLIQPFFVRGSSMEPNFDNGQYLVINEISYRFDDPERGDVIVFRYPMDPKQYYIKRIIGLPGETVEIKNGKVFIYNDEFLEGTVLDESLYLDSNTLTLRNTHIELGKEEYFVLGDNRAASSDSRQWGSLDSDYIIGCVWLRAWPFDVMEVF